MRRAWPVLGFLLLAATARAAPFDPDLPYPGEVALSQEAKGFVFRRFPGSQRLYTFDADKDGSSACNSGCAGAHPAVIAPPGAKTVGDWTIIRREDGQDQWAYRGRPVYTFYHDAPGAPAGEGGGWHLVPHER